MRHKAVAVLAALVALATSTFAGTISGQIQTPTGGVISNGTLSFRLSQPAVLSGTASITSSSANCYTSAAGSIVGLPDPLATVSLAANTASGTLAAGTYYVKFTYSNASGESVASSESAQVLSAQGTLIVNPPTLQPNSASGYNVYIGSTPGAETKQATITGWTQYQQTSSLASGAALPGSNSSVCSLVFSDQLIPTGTSYTVTLVNRNGSLIAGFPQTWCTFGGAVGNINVSNGAPTGNCGTNGVFYPTPILANPQSDSLQSINSDLALVGNLFLSGQDSLTGSGIFTNLGMNPNSTRLLNGANLKTEWQYGQGIGFDTEGYSAAIIVPAGSTVHQISPFAGYCDSFAASSGGNSNNCVAGYFAAYSHANGASIYGINTLMSDFNGITGSRMFNEFDINVNGSPALVIGGALITGQFTGTFPPGGVTPGLTGCPSSGSFVFVVCPASGTQQFTDGIVFSRGMISTTAFHVDATSNTATPSGSATYEACGWDGSAAHCGTLGATSSGTMNLSGLSSGAVTLVAGTASHTFTVAYSAPPNCALGPTITGQTYKYAIGGGGTSITVTSSSGADTSVVAFMCYPTLN